VPLVYYLVLHFISPHKLFEESHNLGCSQGNSNRLGFPTHLKLGINFFLDEFVDVGPLFISPQRDEGLSGGNKSDQAS
jgi:hypothetical protein